MATGHIDEELLQCNECLAAEDEIFLSKLSKRRLQLADALDRRVDDRPLLGRIDVHKTPAGLGHDE